MKNLIISVSLILIFMSCENKTDENVATQFKSYVNFVDSIEKLKSNFVSGFDTVYTERPVSPKSSEIAIDTMVIQHKKLFETTKTGYGKYIVSIYNKKLEIIDSMDRANCFTQEQRNEIGKAKKKFEKMVAEGTTEN